MFWVTGTTTLQLWRQQGAGLQSYIEHVCRTRGDAAEIARLPDVQRDISLQLARLPHPLNQRAQIGIEVPTLYYKHPDDPDILDLSSEGLTLLVQRAGVLDGIKRKRIERMSEAFQALTHLVGKREYALFLQKWGLLYRSGDVSEIEISRQSGRTAMFAIREQRARQALNFWLY
jgi:hypothetical protein